MIRKQPTSTSSLILFAINFHQLFHIVSSKPAQVLQIDDTNTKFLPSAIDNTTKLGYNSKSETYQDHNNNNVQNNVVMSQKPSKLSGCGGVSRRFRRSGVIKARFA